ncbi:MAG: YlmC/YmxH family sporulation protein [Bacillota bacterium]
MRLSELFGKEIVNLYNGCRLGVIGETDLIIDSHTGRIQSLVLPRKPNLLNIWFEGKRLVVPWEAVRKIGNDVIVVDLDNTSDSLGKFAL